MREVITIPITFGGKKKEMVTYRIEKVPMKVSKLYNRIIDVVRDVSVMQARLQKGEDVKEQLEELAGMDIMPIYMDIIRIVLEANEYEFDKERWDSFADEEDVYFFIRKCLEKDKKKQLSMVKNLFSMKTD